MTDAERDRTESKKAKDWDSLEIFYKIHRVEAPKVHTLKLRQGAGVIYDEDILLMLQLVYSVAEHWVDASIIRWPVPQVQGDCSTVFIMLFALWKQQIRAAARACPHGSNLVNLASGLRLEPAAHGRGGRREVLSS